MEPFLARFDPILQALLATFFTWGVTAAGAAIVFFTAKVSRRFLDASLGFTAGVMIAASCWSLLVPAIDLSREMGALPWFPPLVGFLLGAAFLRMADRLLPHLHLFLPVEQAEGLRTRWAPTTLLVLAITLHNIPEGLAVGVAFGAAAVLAVRPILPYAMAFAAGAMIFVVVEEVIPESQQGGQADLATLGAMVGFAVMMTLDVALG